MQLYVYFVNIKNWTMKWNGMEIEGEKHMSRGMAFRTQKANTSARMWTKSVNSYVVVHLQNTGQNIFKFHDAQIDKRLTANT